MPTGPAAIEAMSATDLVLSGPLVVAVLLAVAAGLVSFLSPCCLPLVPGYLSYVAGMTGAETRVGVDTRSGDSSTDSGTIAVLPVTDRRAGSKRVVLGAILFVTGFAAVFTSYGALFGTFGSLLVEHQATLVRVLGAVTIVLGLMFTGWFWRIPIASRSVRFGYRPRAGLAGAPILGVMFGLGWTPCIGPTLAAVLTLATTSAGAGRGAVLAFAYSIGLGIPFIVAAFSVSRAMARLQWARRYAPAVMMVGGLALVALGVLQVSGLWFEPMTQLQTVVANWQTPI